MEYDFSQINDKEFEALVADLLSAHFGKRIERFKPGRDGGVDGRFFSVNNNEIILQCKHYLGTGYKGLIAKLKKEEAPKVKKLLPEKYIFATALPLSRHNKKEIRNIFQPFIKRDDDIFGQEDLNDLLSKNSNIEERHFKLWITSTTVLNRLLNNAIKGRSEFKLESIKEKTYKYVQTVNHEKALEKLKNEGVLIISGEPGIGKTTLAENLCLYFASKNYEFISIEESLSEAEELYNRERRQIYYFDDFLGSSYFEAIKDKKDSHIVNFIERIRKDELKRLILTSRTNILNSGVLHSPIFANNKIQNREFLLEIKSLTDLDRAKILYNHIWHSSLSEDFIEVFYIDKRYKEIIKHKNFNPRLIEFITDTDRINVSDSSEYWDYIKKMLDNPKDIWADSFKRQDNEFVRGLVNLTVLNGGEISEEDLVVAYNTYLKIENLRNRSHTEKDFESMSELAVKSYLNRNIKYSNIKYSLFNPSIADYIINDFSQKKEKLKSIFQSLPTVKSIQQLKSLEINNLISKKEANNTLKFLLEDALKNNKSLDYQIYLSSLLKEDESERDNIISVLKRTIDQPEAIQEFSKFLVLINYFNKDLKIYDYSFLVLLIGSRYLDESEISDFLSFIDEFDIDDQYIIDCVQYEIESYLKAEIVFSKNDIDVNDFIDYFHEYDEIEIDRGGIKDGLINLAWDIIYKFESPTIESMEFDLDEIISEVDIDKMVNEFLESQGDTDEGGWSGPRSYDQDIDDLFDRG